MSEGDELVEEAAKRLGSVLAGKWTLERVLGVGGMASVYGALHRNGARAAVKILHGALITHPEALTRFRREAQIANRVEHPGVVKVLDDDITPEGEPFLVMELLRGESLEGRALRSGGRLPLGDALTFAEKTLAVLEAAHAKGIIHRDLKPENLFVTTEGELKVLDFGIARLREGDNKSQTRTGMAMGTPAYMAPEQALARWADVDARTDLWAVGAIIFSLVTGRTVHEGETASEVMVFAATRPAPSIARFAQVPIEVTRLVDRALSFDAAQRFPDAASMRAEVAAALALVAKSGPPPPAATTSKPAATASASPHAPTLAQTKATPLRRDDDEGAFDTAYATAEDVLAMSELFTLLERALFATARYGPGHPEAQRQLEATLTRCVSGLDTTESALVWNVTPYGFSVPGQMVWEPRAPFDRVPYQLFSDGVRVMGLLPGLAASEFQELVNIITTDRARNMAPEDDFVTLMWEAGLEHVVYQAVDAFVEGDQNKLTRFEADASAVEALASFDTSFQLEHCWAERDRNAPATVETQKKRLLSILEGARLDAESLVRAEGMQARAQVAPVAEGALAVEGATLVALGARLDIDTVATGERFVLCVALAYGDVHGTPRAGAVVTPLRSAMDGLAAQNPAAAVALVSSLAAAFDRVDAARAEVLRAAVVGAIVSPRTMKLLLLGAIAAKAEREVFGHGLDVILRYADDAHVSIALTTLGDLQEGSLRDLVLVYLARVGKGHEARMGAAFAEADLELGLALIRVLSRIGTPEARTAILRATTSPHTVVRIEALSHLEGVSSDRVRLELKALLEDHEPGVRMAALRTIGKHQVRVAGPSLVLRIRSSEFDKLKADEKRVALETLAVLAQNRAEAVCLELLAEAPLLSSEAHEQTRELAAEILGTIGGSPDVLEALGAASTSRWRNSERVRASAARAKEQVEVRISVLPPGSRRP